ncbi:MAG TPA: tail-specific protease, partial [Succinivibrionaceae bacterium]|nr:tail-specific protease [Succinivibrionaceae bacterium]
MRKRFAKYLYFLEAIKSTPKAENGAKLELDRTKAAFIANDDDLKRQWHNEIVNEYDNQILSGNSDEQARERLNKRYSAALSKLAQTNSEDAFSAFENAFATAIDPHTNYFSPQDTENFNDDMNLSLEGIGAVLTSEDEYTSITEVIPGSPAERSKKIKAKDRIVGVKQQDGTYDDVTGWRLNDVVRKIKGPKGTKVTLEIERGEGSSLKTFSVELVRDKIRLQDREAKGEVKTAYDGTKVGVISVKSFYTNLHQDLKRELLKLKAQQVASVIVDLRSD